MELSALEDDAAGRKGRSKAWRAADSAALVGAIQSLPADADADGADADTDTGGLTTLQAEARASVQRRRQTRLLVCAGVVAVLLLLVVVVPVAVVLSRGSGGAGLDAVLTPTPTPAPTDTSPYQCAGRYQSLPAATRTPGPTAAPVVPVLQWSEVAFMPTQRSDQTADTLNGMVYLTGGCVGEQTCGGPYCACSNITASVLAFDPFAFSFEELAPMPVPRYRHCSCTWRDSIYVFNGRTLETDEIIDQVDQFNTTTNAWSTKASLYPDDVGSDNACFTIGDVIYIMGGYSPDYSVAFNTTYRYYPATDTWVRDAAQLEFGRGDFSAVPVGRKGFIYGGYVASDFCKPIDSMEMFDPDEHTWTPRAAPGENSAQKRAGVELEGRLLSFGGETKSKTVDCVDTDLVPLSRVRSYDPVSNTWRNESSLPQPLFRFAAAVVDERLFVFGGQGELIAGTAEDDVPYFPVLSNVYEFDYVFESTPTPAPSAAPTAEAPALSINATVLPFYGGRSQDEAGTALCKTDFNGDGRQDLVVGTWNELVYVVPGGRTSYNFTGSYRLTDVQALRAYVYTGENAGDDFGSAGLAGEVDFNGDGIQDLIVGAPGYEGDNGAAYIIYGTNETQTEPLSMRDLGSRGVRIYGPRLSGQCGISVSVGDFDGDGLADLLVGCSGRDVNKVFLIWGLRPWPSVINLDAPPQCSTVSFTESLSHTSFGYSMPPRAIDINSDGFDDIIMSAPWSGTNRAGAVFVYYGRRDNWTPTVTLASTSSASSRGFNFIGAPYDVLGYSVAAAGDINGDGKMDLIIGAPTDTSLSSYARGAVYVVFGFATSQYASVPRNPSQLSGTNGLRIYSPNPLLGLGAAVSSAGDQNDDGVDDIVFGLPFATLADAPSNCILQGVGVVLFGKAGGYAAEYNLGYSVSPADGFVIGLTNFCQSGFGLAVLTLPEFVGDDADLIIVGAPFASSPGRNSDGAVTLWINF